MLLTFQESADYLKVSQPTLRIAIKKRGLGVVRFGRTIRINKEHLDAWIRENTQFINSSSSENDTAPVGEG